LISTPVAVALGSNLGDRERTLHNALHTLRSTIRDLQASSFYDTEPAGYLRQPRFLNAAAVGATVLDAPDLLAFLLDVERRYGRVRSFPNAPRSLDLDLVFYGDAVIDVPGLTVPHPRFRERAFVLDPLAEIAPDWRDPVTGLTVAELREGLHTVE
jgi:2-amino-4-hydroxy-6-hydroxymethyldihydropteridine diphosphokinase